MCNKNPHIYQISVNQAMWGSSNFMLLVSKNYYAANSFILKSLCAQNCFVSQNCFVPGIALFPEAGTQPRITPRISGI